MRGHSRDAFPSWPSRQDAAASAAESWMRPDNLLAATDVDRAAQRLQSARGKEAELTSAVLVSLRVAASPQRAFEVFTQEIEQAGFRQVEERKGLLDESYFVRFEKVKAP